MKHSIGIAEVKNAARGRWLDVLRDVAGISPDLLDGKHHPCPKCGGVDRFRLVDADAGAVLCNQCLKERNGNGIAAVEWMLGVQFFDALRKVAEYLGVGQLRNGAQVPGDLIAEICKAKRIPKDAFLQIGAKLAKRGKLTVCRLPMFDAAGGECSEFDIALTDPKWSKGLCKKGAPAGLFLADPKPRPGRSVVVTEGCKDAAALLSLGYDAVGLPTCTIKKALLPWFTGCDVVILPDLDKGGVEGAQQSAKNLAGIAASVKLATLPGEIVGSHGDGVREVLARPEGEALVRAAIAGAEPLADSSAGQPSEAEQDDELWNYSREEGEDGGKESKKPKHLSEVSSKILHATSGMPMRVGRALCVHDVHGTRWLERAPHLQAYLRRHFRNVDFAAGATFASVSDVFSDLQTVAEEYAAIEDLPHWPPMPGTFYTCAMPQPGDGKTLAALLARFKPATEVDGDLVKALLLSVIWGGAGGTRPAFVITSDDGRGAGKSALAEMVGLVAGGMLTFSSNEAIGDIKARLLSPEALSKRIALLDNIKSHRFSWAEMEALVTAPVVSGRRLYVGEGSRLNTLLWLLTLNGASLSTDMAQRCVVIKLKRPERSASWAEDTRAYVQANRDAIIADIIAELQQPAAPLARYSRWAAWERDVLSKLPEPEEAQRAIAERQEAADVDLDEAEQIEAHFREQLEGLGYVPDAECVFLPSKIAARWLSEVKAERVSPVAAGRMLKQLVTEGRMRSLQLNRRHGDGRGFLWVGQAVDFNDPVCLDVAKRLEERTEGRRQSGLSWIR